MGTISCPKEKNASLVFARFYCSFFSQFWLLFFLDDYSHMYYFWWIQCYQNSLMKMCPNHREASISHSNICAAPWQKKKKLLKVCPLQRKHISQYTYSGSIQSHARVTYDHGPNRFASYKRDLQQKLSQFNIFSSPIFTWEIVALIILFI